MNDHEIERIAGAVHLARPDWPVKQLTTLLRDKLGDRARRDVFVALAWIACEPDTASPYRVLESGPWWKAAGVTGELTRRHPTPAAACRTCGHDVTTCGSRGCENPTTRPLQRDPEWQTEQAAKARTLLHARGVEA